MNFNPNSILITILFLILIVVSITDIRYRIIPNRLMYPALIFVLAWRAFIHPLPFTNYLIAAVAGGGIFYLTAILGYALLKENGVGGGDIKLMVLIGLCLGVRITFITIFAAVFSGWIVGLFFLLTRKLHKNSLIPFAPCISVAAAAAVLWGDSLITKYFNLLMPF